MYRHAVLLLLFAFCHSASAEPDSAERLEEVQSELEALSDSIDDNKQQRDALYKTLKRQSRAVSDLNRELRDLDGLVKEKDRQLARLEKEQQQFERAHKQQLKALNTELRAAYLSAQPHYLKVLLSQQSPEKISRTTTYFQYFHQARQDQLVGISDSLETLDYERNDLILARQQQRDLYQQQDAKRQRLEQQNEQRLATAKQLDSTLSKQGARLRTLQQEAQALSDLLTSLAERKSAPPAVTQPFPKLKGQLLWPINGKVTARYGSSRKVGKLTWQGIMIKTAIGKEVISAAGGRVVFSDWLRGFGLLLIIDHGDKYMTLYGNNQSLLKAVGETVSAGELIALSGDQGIKQAAGLYFELRHKGNPTDPAKWLAKRS